MPLVFVIILNYRSTKPTQSCAKQALGLRYPNFRVLIVDNGPAEESELLKLFGDSDVKVICSGGNLGYSGGNNVGIRYALEQGAEFVWLVNPDTTLSPDALAPLVDTLSRDTSIAVAGPVVHAGDVFLTGNQLLPRQAYLVDKKVSKERPAPSGPKLWDTAYAEGCAILIRSAVLKELGLLREEFFLYYEETEFCLRSRDRGYRVVICAESLVHTQADGNPRPRRFFQMVRNSILLARMRHENVLRTILLQSYRPAERYLRARLRGRGNPDGYQIIAHLRAVWSGVFTRIGAVPSAPETSSIPSRHVRAG